MQARQINGLEFLRGLCALLVALNHMVTWGQLTRVENWGVNGVSVFFVISGAVIYHNYHHLPSLPRFLFKRFARLAPLYLLALLLTVIGLQLRVGWRDLVEVSMLFGAFDNQCQVAGCWSLGVEFLLYALFPVLLAFTTTPRTLIATLVFLLIMRVASLQAFQSGLPIEVVWHRYTQVGPALFLFFGGMVIAKTLEGVHVSSWLLWTVGAIAMIGLFAVPTYDSSPMGLIGVLNALLCLGAVACFYQAELPLSKFLGEISYGLYLLHPIVWGTFHTLLHLPLWLCMTLTLPCTATFAWLVLRMYEKPMKRWLLSIGSERGTAIASNR